MTLNRVMHTSIIFPVSVYIWNFTKLPIRVFTTTKIQQFKQYSNIFLRYNVTELMLLLEIQYLLFVFSFYI